MGRRGLGSELEGAKNVFILVSPSDVPGAAGSVIRGLEHDAHLRAVVVCRPEDEPLWRDHLQGRARVALAMTLGDVGRAKSVGGSLPAD